MRWSECWVRHVNPAKFRSPTLTLPGNIEDEPTYVQLLIGAVKACTRTKSVEIGRTIHWDAVQTGTFSAPYISSALVHMYSKSGSLTYAREVFDSITDPSLASWTTLMTGYATHGEAEKALEMFSRLETEGGHLPDDRTFVAAIMACSSLAEREAGQAVSGKIVKLSSLEKGRAIHSKAVDSGLDADIYVSSTLIDMYAKCKSMPDARTVFERMPVNYRRDVVPWNTLILGYAENDEEELALELFDLMQGEKCEPNPRTFVAAVIACGNFAAREDSSRQVDGKPASVWCLDKGMAIHSQAEKSGYGVDLFLASSLVNMYAKCSSMVKAQFMFEKMSRKDVVLWNALILGYVDNGEPELALQCFWRMQKEGSCTPIARTFVPVLMACASLATKVDRSIDLELSKNLKAFHLERVKAIHLEAARAGCEFEVYVASTLVDTYAKCGSLADAKNVFERMPNHDIVSWNSLIQGYAENGEGTLAFGCFRCMQARGVVPDARTIVAAFMSCLCLIQREEGDQVETETNVKCLESAMEIHSKAANYGYLSDIFVAGVLVELYVKCRSMLDARIVFDRVPLHNIVSWTALMMGYAENGEPEVTLELYAYMRRESWYVPNSRSFVAVVAACGNLVGLEIGKGIHAEICETALESDRFVANSLVDMYAKCGSLTRAESVFQSMQTRNMVSWSALISGYSSEGYVCEAFDKLEKMEEEGFRVNSITCLSLLSACGHAGLIQAGKNFFSSITSRYGLQPGVEHYHCMIDMLGRANLLDEALEMANKMPQGANILTWKTLLGACCKWNNVRVGEIAFQKIVQADDKQASAYVLMANIYRTAGMHAEELRLQKRVGL